MVIKLWMDKQFAALKYLKSLARSIELANIEVHDFSVAQGEEDTITPYDIEIKMTVKGFTMPLYELLM